MNEKERDKSRNKSRISTIQTNTKVKDPLLNEIFFDKYKTIKKLGEGSFGKVYKAEYNGEYFALKFESRSRPKSLLEMEGTIMTYLQGPNIPFIKTYGYSGDYNLLVMQLMDRSLEDIIRIRKTFSIKTTAMIGFQLIGALHYIHDKSIIHRDVKPDNCVMGREELNENLYLIDFGLAKKYRSTRTLKQYPLTKKKRLTGTARYASINALEGYEQSRRDDMESVGYILAYFLRGSLPWQGLKLKSKENKYKNILEKKKEISSEELFKGFPNEFVEILEYTKQLDYLEEPEYQMLRNKLMDLCKRLKYNFDFIYDWTTERDLEKRKMKKVVNSLRTQSTVSRKFKKRTRTKKKYVEK
jgi:serine/threonine protein kinase